MKLLRFGPIGQERPGMVDGDGRIRDLSDHVTDFKGETVAIAALERLHRINPANLPLVEGQQRIGACLADVPNFYAIGRNYAAHAAETGSDLPTEPLIFNKATSCLNGPFDDIPLPPGSDKIDWEVELGVVIGAHVSQVPEDEALAQIAGYCIVNDVSARDWQKDRGGQWVKGKSAPGFGPIGPWLVTADEIANPQALAMSLALNGEVRQSASTADMVFNVAHLISYMSRFFALRPGDIIATGTPEGVGAGAKPPRFLRPGDRLRLEVQGLGRQESRIV